MKIVQEIYVHQESINDQSLTVVGLNFKNGDLVKNGDTLIELETSKAIVTIEAETDGYIIYHCILGQEVLLNDLIIRVADEKPTENLFLPLAPVNTESKEIVHNDVPSELKFQTEFSKKATALLERNSLSKSLFENYDFVTEYIVLKYLNPGYEKQGIPELKENSGSVENRKTEPLKNVTYQKLPAGKKREIEYLSSVQRNGLVSTLYVSIDTRGILNSINKKLSYFKESILTLVAFEAARLLLKYPLLNSFFENNQIGKYDAINIGIAIDIDDGLKVVKLPNTESLDIFQIEEKIFELSNKYLDKKLTISDLSDITFTITDLSATSTFSFVPLINKNNAAILGIARIDKKTGACILSLSFDHRVTEGKYASNFLSELKTRLESYSLSDDETLKLMVCYRCLKEITEDLNDTGFIKVQTKNGDEKLICDICLFKF